MCFHLLLLSTNFRRFDRILRIGTLLLNSNTNLTRISEEYSLQKQQQQPMPFRLLQLSQLNSHNPFTRLHLLRVLLLRFYSKRNRPNWIQRIPKLKIVMISRSMSINHVLIKSRLRWRNHLHHQLCHQLCRQLECSIEK